MNSNTLIYIALAIAMLGQCASSVAFLVGLNNAYSQSNAASDYYQNTYKPMSTNFDYMLFYNHYAKCKCWDSKYDERYKSR